VKKPEDDKWSSAQAHLQGEDHIRVNVGPPLEIIPNWQELLSNDLSEEEYETLRRHERSGRPLGNNDVMAKVDKLSSRVLRR